MASRIAALVVVGVALFSAACSTPGSTPSAGSSEATFVDFYGAEDNDGYDLWEVYRKVDGKEVHLRRATFGRTFNVGDPVLRVKADADEMVFVISPYQATGTMRPRKTDVVVRPLPGKITPVKLVKVGSERKKEVKVDSLTGRTEIRTYFNTTDEIFYTPVVGQPIEFVALDRVPYRYARPR